MNHVLIIKKSLPLSMTIVLSLAILSSVVRSANAQESSVALGRNVSTASSQGQGPTDAAELEAFLDELLASQMDEHHIAGAAVSVVKDGGLFFAKGYGYADLENSIPVDPEQTGFRIGSVTKLFTATAVMQLVEQASWTWTRISTPISTFAFRIPIQTRSPSSTC
ncbi:MAG TPA: serine hydrolase domain-containing protein [Anaerolineales bacterium]|nr:serine hydrolase domain-containing protein [Anaerolineales bacterium]